MPGAGHSIGHAEIQIEDSRIMLADEHPDMNFRGPHSFGGAAMHNHLYVQDVDRVVKKALTAGAKLLRPVADQFYGDRNGSLEDVRTRLACRQPQRKCFDPGIEKARSRHGCVG